MRAPSAVTRSQTIVVKLWPRLSEPTGRAVAEDAETAIPAVGAWAGAAARSVKPRYFAERLGLEAW